MEKIQILWVFENQIRRKKWPTSVEFTESFGQILLKNDLEKTVSFVPVF